MKYEVLFVIVLTAAFITGFSLTSSNISNEPIMESSIRDWGWAADYCDKKSFVIMKLNGVYTKTQTFHEYCNI